MRPEDLRLILASGSPRRHELLNTAGLFHEVIVSGAEEDMPDQDPCHLVEMLSQRKAKDVFTKLESDREMTEHGKDRNFAVIGADTVVALDGKILGKPSDEADAARMLRMLSGRMHHVCTGVTIHGCIEGSEYVRTFSEVSCVHVAKLSEEEIRAYLLTSEPMDKAGSYGIQGAFSRYVTRIEGDYFNIVGLPVSRVYRELKKFAALV